MRDDDVRLKRSRNRWHVEVRSGAQGAAYAAWVSLGGPNQMTATRVWLALLMPGRRR